MENPFGEFQSDWKKTDATAPPSPDRVPPGSYKFICTTSDPKGDGTLVDHGIIIGKQQGTKGLKLFCEIVEPETALNEKTSTKEETKGKVLEHVMWVTKNTLGRIKWDLCLILGQESSAAAKIQEDMNNVTKVVWAGRTFEGVVYDEEYQGRTRSRIGFINPWNPEGPIEPSSKGGKEDSVPF